MNQQYATVKQLLEMQKAASDNIISGMMMFWDQTGTMLDWAVGFPEEGKKAFKQWIEVNKQGCKNLKTAIDSGYSNLGKFFENKG